MILVDGSRELMGTSKVDNDPPLVSTVQKEDPQYSACDEIVVDRQQSMPASKLFRPRRET